MSTQPSVPHRAEPVWDVFTFGETMLRLSPPGHGRLEEAVALDVRVGGSESNTAVALARLGMRVSWWSKLPANALGRRIAFEIQRWGVDTSDVLWDQDEEARAGLYFLDIGVAPRGIDVTYDRRSSSASRIAPEELPVGHIHAARLLHMTGITPALSPGCSAAVERALQAAQLCGTPVSLDLNFRSRLWSAEAARRRIEALLSRVQLLIAPLRDAGQVFGMSGSAPDVARTLRSSYGIHTVVVTSGEAGAAAVSESGEWQVEACPVTQSVDRVGGGDAFCAGVLFGYLQGDVGIGLEYGAAMAALKHTIPGDLLLVTAEEIEAVRAGQSTAINR